MRASRKPSAVVIGGQDAYLQAGNLHKVTRLDLSQLLTACGDGQKQATGACRGDDDRGGWNQPQ
jgi:hypothetical protein